MRTVFMNSRMRCDIEKELLVTGQDSRSLKGLLGNYGQDKLNHVGSLGKNNNLIMFSRDGFSNA